MGGLGADWIHGGTGDDAITGGDEYVKVLLFQGLKTYVTAFYGGVPGDVLDGGGDNDTVHGGGGDDQILGGLGRDLLYGQAGDDEIDGGGGNDRLVGADGNDVLSGGAGMDALFALRGDDITIDGGADSDRIYVATASLAKTYAAGDDAAFHIANGAGGNILVEGVTESWMAASWTQAELDDMDDAIRLMHELNKTDTTIQKKGGGYVSLTRGGTCTDANILGWNASGAITMLDPTVNDAWWFGRTVVHELGHNWDTENPDWDDFLAISGWTKTKHDGDAGWAKTTRYGEDWWYQTSANFYRDFRGVGDGYSHSHPV